MPPSLSRTSSTTSFASAASTRTRTRFTTDQLALLESLYHQTSHPSRQERDTLANETGMQLKHITIWFQNKRQMHRRVALQNSTNERTSHHHREQHFAPLPYNPAHSKRPTSGTLPVPSLDHIASHSELRNPPPRTPARKPKPNAVVWEIMPSSPLAPSETLETLRDREKEKTYIEFSKQHVKAKGRRSLEWACASARVAGSGGKENVDIGLSLNLDDLGEGDETDEDEEVHEAITPSGSFRYGDEADEKVKMATHDEEMMAAYALCGLGLGFR